MGFFGVLCVVFEKAFAMAKQLEPFKIEIIDEFLIFKCPKITYIDIPETTRIIRRDIMRNCSSLKVVNMPRNSVLEEIQEQVFRSCKVEYIVIPKTVVTIRWDICSWNIPKTKMFCEVEQAPGGWMSKRWNSYDAGNATSCPMDELYKYVNPTYFYSETPKANCWRWVGDEPTPW
jgi:hypothetical protein